MMTRCSDRYLGHTNQHTVILHESQVPSYVSVGPTIKCIGESFGSVPCRLPIPIHNEKSGLTSMLFT